MAQLGLGVAGAAIAAVGAALLAPETLGGSIAAYAAIAGLGFAVGSAAGALLFPPPGQHIQGSRIGDLTITSSTYGVVRPIGHGTVQVSGNIIWALPIQEIATTSSVSGGKGSAGSRGNTVTTYTYSLTFALALAQGPATGVVRIWMNGALVYDASSGSNVVNDGADNVNFRFYPGDNEQLPDSLIEADKGVGNVPGYRGLCYLVFDGLILTNFGDHVPNVQVEVTYGTVFSQDFDALDVLGTTPRFDTITGPVFREIDGFINDNDVPTVQTVLMTSTGGILSLVDVPGTVPTLFSGGFGQSQIGIDPIGGKGFVWGIAPAGICAFDLASMTVLGQYTLDYMLGTFDVYGSTAVGDTSNPLWVGFDGNLYGILGSHVLKVNATTFRNATLLYCGNDDNIGGPIVDNFAEIGGPIGMTSSSGATVNYTIVGGGNMGNVKVIDFDGAPVLPLSSHVAGAVPGTGGIAAIVPGVFDVDIGTTYIVGLGGTGDGNGGTIFVDAITLTGDATSQSINSGNVLTIAPTDLEAGASGFMYASGAVFDSIDNSIIFQVQVYNGGAGNSYLVKVDPNTGDVNFGVVWATQLPAGLGANKGGPSTMTSDLRQGSYAYFYGSNAVQFRTSDGTIVDNFAWAISNDGGQVYSGAFNAILMFGGGTGTWVKVKVGRLASSPQTLQTIVTDICEMAGMIADDFDASALASISIDGFAVAQRTTAADILQPLLQLYQVDVVERDYKIVFQPRGGTPVTTITQDLMLRDAAKTGQDSGEPYVESRTQEIDMPMRFTVSYIDSTVQYQTNTQMAKRIVAPNRTMYSDQQVDLQVGIVMDPVAAAQQAEKLLYTAWLERHTIKFAVGPELSYLDTADPVLVSLDNGFTTRGRLKTFDIGADGSVQTMLVAEAEGQYTSVTQGNPAQGVPTQTVKYYTATMAFLLDVPLLRDVDDTQGGPIRAYWSAAPTSSGGTWSPAVLQGSSDRLTWTSLDTEVTQTTWGYLESPLPDAKNCFHIREQDTIILKTVTGGQVLSSVTETQMINGANAAAVMKANGDVEIIGFVNVTPLGNSRYQLQGLLRGRRGTDTMATGHQANEVCVLLAIAATDPLTVPFAQRNQLNYYRTISQGQLAQSAQVQAQTFHGRDQMPYAPVQVTATLSGSDIVLTWVRRTRINGGLQWETGTVPLSEATESYSIDIYDALGATVLRTLTSTSPTVTYTAANIATDFGSTPTQLNVSVYQISATVGRGFARLDELEVA